MYDTTKQIILSFVLLLSVSLQAQTVGDKLKEAFAAFEADGQLSSAIASLYVMDATSGAVVFEKAGRVGLAPASTQKVITAATAYALLGKDFRYKTEFGYMGRIEGQKLNGSFYILPSFDPTLGSWRWATTNDSAIMSQWINTISRMNITSYGGLTILDSGWKQERVPDGWMWQDIGNYYGAGAGKFNWRENQFDIVLKSGDAIGSKVEIALIKPQVPGILLQSYATAAAKGTGDNAYVYFPQSSLSGVVRGTIPVSENAFVISAAVPNPAESFISLMNKRLNEEKKLIHANPASLSLERKLLGIHLSPTLDSINYWFQKRSINLYGEALVKTISFYNDGSGTTEKGISLIKKFWNEKGIGSAELNIVDGSGLSPLNRVTTRAQVEVLRYAKNQNWFSSYYDALPIYNDMKMKSGTISGAKGFCGYHKSKEGREYIFSFLVNNYNGSASSVVKKMYKVLDVLK
jgi:D-alanyl-D-alanine carboxypeptidase/D-alanyl-D-alanine-endopeptidase (penicillin-binding protein 4)